MCLHGQQARVLLSYGRENLLRYINKNGQLNAFRRASGIWQRGVFADGRSTTAVNIDYTVSPTRTRYYRTVDGKLLRYYTNANG